MKLRYFIPSLMAVVAAMFTGCSDDNDPTYLSEIRVSQSYVALSTGGGSASIDVQAAGSWTVSGAPDWSKYDALMRAAPQRVAALYQASKE